MTREFMPNPPPQELTESLRSRIVEMVSNGMNRADVTKLLNQDNEGLNLQYVTTWWVCRGLSETLKRDICRAKRFVDGQPRSQVINDLYFDQGLKVRDIANKLGCDYQAVWSCVAAKRLKDKEEAQAQREADAITRGVY